MSRELDESYFEWLYSQVCSPRTRNRSKSYRTLLDQLFRKEFLWLVANDDNRAEDGRLLRSEFLHDEVIFEVDPEWVDLECSMLEMLIGISRRLSFKGGGEPPGWFWHLIENLELIQYNDRRPIPQKEVNEVLERVIWRLYSPDGVGGLFPLNRATDDQRRVELWYQLNAYLLQRGA